MEDEDEFGDLYTDVLRPFSSSSALQSHQQPSQPDSAPPSVENAAGTRTSTLRSDEDDTLRAPSDFSPTSNLKLNLNINPNPNLNSTASARTHDPNLNPPTASQDLPVLGKHEPHGLSANSPSDSPQIEASKTRVLEGCDFNLNTELMATDQSATKDENLRLHVQEQDDDGPVIPGISGCQPTDNARNSDLIVQDEANAQGDDWESDSEDDIQIVLNDNHHHHQRPMSVDGNAGKVDDDDDEDEDGDPLVILDDSDAVHHQPQEEQGWAEDAGQAPEGERKEASEAGKANGGVSSAPKTGYNNYGYHPFHSQFKYVRPGAPPLPGGPGGSGQVRPPVSMGVVGGRGRGDWRPAGMKGASLQKSGFWGSNVSGRGFGGDFTLSSQKTIFDVDIDSFDEKPWNYPGIDVADFFNFDLNEEAWKEYCKQLERLRMQSTMKNKAHVLVVGSRPEQEYDPDLPPELAAAAAGIQDPSAENSKVERADVGQYGITKGAVHMRLPLPTGRAIQVEAGSGERLPSADTRLSRARDSDAVIEIVLQDSPADDTSTGIGAADQPDNVASREDLRDDTVEEDGEQIRNEYSDGHPHLLDSTKGGDNVRRLPRVNALRDKVPKEEEESASPLEAPVKHPPGPRMNSPVYPSDKFEASHEERQMNAKADERSQSTSPGRSALDGSIVDDKQEESNESMEAKDSPHGLSFEGVVSDDELFQTERNYVKKEEYVDLSAVVSSNTSDTSKSDSMRKLKLSSQVDHMTTKEIDEVGYLKAARSSDNSRATGNSRDHQKGHDVVDEEVIQDEHSSHAKYLKRNLGEDGKGFRRKDRDGSMETDKSNMLVKGGEGSYPHRYWDPYSPHSSHVKIEGFDRRKERDYADGMLQQRGEDPKGRKFRADDSRKHEHGDGMIPRHRGKVREGERTYKDEHMPPRKLSENGNWRGYCEREAGLHIRENDDILKTRYENVDDPHSKRRKDDEHARRDHFDKDEILRAQRESSSRRKRERDESLDRRKRDDLHRRENTDDYRSVRSKDEGWLQRERVERHRERDDWSHSRQSHEDNLSRKEREDGRASIRSGRNVEDKGWVGHSRKDDYKGFDRDNSYKDNGRSSEQLTRKDRIEDASSLQYRGIEDARKGQLGYEERRSRQEKSTVRSDRAINASDNQRVHEKKPKENLRKGRELEGGQHSTSNSSKKSQEENGRNEMAGVTGTSEQGNEDRISAQLHTSKQKMEDASSADQHGSKRGRSKLERWTSHKERDHGINTKPSSSLKVDAEKDKNLGAGRSAKVKDEKKSQALDSSHSAAEVKEGGVPEVKEADVMMPMEDKHLDTVAKLKKRSERFKLPMPSEKDTATIKKMESEPLSSTANEAPANSEMKQERPPRKRRWTSNQAK